MRIRLALACFAAFGAVASSAWSQETSGTNDVQQGHHLAIIICANCHVAAPDQDFQPILRPPAPSFDSIAQRGNINADTLQTFLTTTHRDINNPGGMSNPQLLDFQIKQVSAYVLSLQKQPNAPHADRCSTEIARVAALLSKAQANRKIAPSAPESTAARLHRQPTPETVTKAETDAEKKVDAALTLARKLDADGKESECVTALENVALLLGVH